MEDRTDRGFLQYIQCQSDPNRRHGIQYVGARDARRVAERHEHFAGASDQIWRAPRLLGLAAAAPAWPRPALRALGASPRLTRPRGLALPGGWAPERIETCSARPENLRLDRSSHSLTRIRLFYGLLCLYRSPRQASATALYSRSKSPETRIAPSRTKRSWFSSSSAGTYR